MPPLFVLYVHSSYRQPKLRTQSARQCVYPRRSNETEPELAVRDGEHRRRHGVGWCRALTGPADGGVAGKARGNHPIELTAYRRLSIADLMTPHGACLGAYPASHPPLSRPRSRLNGISHILGKLTIAFALVDNPG